MQDTQHSNEHDLPDHVEALYSRYWRDSADKWRAVEVEVRGRGRLLECATYSCTRNKDSERLKLVEARKLGQQLVIRQLDSDIAWSKRKAILSKEMVDPITPEKYYARDWWVNPEVKEETKEPAAKEDTSMGLIFAAGIIIIVIAVALKGC
jgi:hypothetical protein